MLEKERLFEVFNLAHSYGRWEIKAQRDETTLSHSYLGQKEDVGLPVWDSKENNTSCHPSLKASCLPYSSGCQGKNSNSYSHILQAGHYHTLSKD